jgi:hypothetical protein
MDLFIQAFTIALGIGAALVVFQIAPALIAAAVRSLTTRSWQARKYRSLIARGEVRAAYWAKSHGFATEE